MRDSGGSSQRTQSAELNTANEAGELPPGFTPQNGSNTPCAVKQSPCGVVASCALQW